jgi:uncharacterized membrane protein YcjF (UPF0283 family)
MPALAHEVEAREDSEYANWQTKRRAERRAEIAELDRRMWWANVEAAVVVIFCASVVLCTAWVGCMWVTTGGPSSLWQWGVSVITTLGG